MYILFYKLIVTWYQLLVTCYFMDMIESVDALFINLYKNIVKSNGDVKQIKQYIKDAQHDVLCYTLAINNNNDLERIKPRIINKECKVVQIVIMKIKLILKYNT